MGSNSNIKLLTFKIFTVLYPDLNARIKRSHAYRRTGTARYIHVCHNILARVRNTNYKVKKITMYYMRFCDGLGMNLQSFCTTSWTGRDSIHEQRRARKRWQTNGGSTKRRWSRWAFSWFLGALACCGETKAALRWKLWPLAPPWPPRSSPLCPLRTTNSCWVVLPQRRASLARTLRL